MFRISAPTERDVDEFIAGQRHLRQITTSITIAFGSAEVEEPRRWGLLTERCPIMSSARRLQKQFARESLARMKSATDLHG